MLKQVNEAVVVCSNGVIAAWHPKRAFPYAHTLPIDLNRVEQERKDLSKALNDKKRFLKTPFGEEGPKLIDLREIFYTPSQEFRPRYRENRLYQMCAPIEKRKK